MNKWIAIPIIAVLAVVVIAGGGVLLQQKNTLADKLTGAESKIVALEGNVSTLQGKLTASEAEVSRLQGKLTASEAEVLTLRGKLTASEGEVSSLRGKFTASEAEVLTLQGKLTASEATVVTLQGKLTASEAAVATLQGKLTASEATVATLQTNLRTANAEVTRLQANVLTQQNLNLTLTAELKKVQDPRHFASLTELADWLRKDDTNTKYAGVNHVQRAFILQVRALRDGYLLPVSLFKEGGTLYVASRAVIEGNVYVVWSSDDYIEWYGYVEFLPSHPLPLD